ARARRVAIPDVECSSPDSPLDQRLVEGILVDDLRTRYVDEDGGRLHRAELALAEEAAGLGRERQRDREVVSPRQHVPQSVGPSDKRALRVRVRSVASDPDDCHVEGVRAPGDALANPAIPEDAERLACQFRPRRRRGDTDRPLALPRPAPQGGVEPRVSVRIAPSTYSAMPIS